MKLGLGQVSYNKVSCKAQGCPVKLKAVLQVGFHHSDFHIQSSGDWVMNI